MRSHGPEAAFDESEGEDDLPLPSPSPSFPHSRSRKFILGVVFAIIFVLNGGMYLTVVPSIRLYEDIICRHYYDGIEGPGHIGLGEEGKIREDMCKGDHVQGELNVIMAGLMFLGAIPALITTIPYGLIADRVGRKPVFVLAVIGMILAQCWNQLVILLWRYIPLRLVWISPVFTLIGGGEVVGNMIFYAIGSDITTDEERVNVFLLGQCVGLVAELIAPSMASGLMAKSSWIPIILGLSLLTFGTLLAALIPETLKIRVDHSDSDTSNSLSDDVTPQIKESLFTAIKSQFRDSLKGSRESFSILTFPILLLLSGFIIQPFGAQIISLSVRYVSNRFSWPLRQAGFLLSLRAFINIIVLLIILPGLSYWLVKVRHLSPKRKDLILARISIVILFIGALLITLSPTAGLTVFGLVTWTLGTGYVPLIRSIISTLVDMQHIGRLYAAIAMVETIGALAAGPSLAALYALGLKWKGMWVALPYFGMAIIAFIAGIGLWLFGLTTRRKWEKDDAGYSRVETDDREEEATLLEDED